MSWIGGIPDRDYSIEAEPVAEHLRNTLTVLDGVLNGFPKDMRRVTDNVGDLLALNIVRRRLWEAIQRLEGPRGAA